MRLQDYQNGVNIENHIEECKKLLDESLELNFNSKHKLVREMVESLKKDYDNFVGLKDFTEYYMAWYIYYYVTDTIRLIRHILNTEYNIEEEKKNYNDYDFNKETIDEYCDKYANKNKIGRRKEYIMNLINNSRMTKNSINSKIFSKLSVYLFAAVGGIDDKLSADEFINEFGEYYTRGISKLTKEKEKGVRLDDIDSVELLYDLGDGLLPFYDDFISITVVIPDGDNSLILTYNKDKNKFRYEMKCEEQYIVDCAELYYPAIAIGEEPYIELRKYLSRLGYSEDWIYSKIGNQGKKENLKDFSK